jgi:hypothetical protein
MALSEFSRWFIPTWYDSGCYENNSIPEIRNSLYKELEKNNLNKIIV